LVVFLFLRNRRATLIPAVVVPTSLIGTFGVMYLCGYSLDNLSLMALTISTGFVVDDAIVVIENVTRHLEQGVRPMQAALKGERAQPDFPANRKCLRVDFQSLPRKPAGCFAAPGDHAGRVGRDHRGDWLPLHRRAEGVLPRAG